MKLSNIETQDVARVGEKMGETIQTFTLQFAGCVCIVIAFGFGPALAIVGVLLWILAAVVSTNRYLRIIAAKSKETPGGLLHGNN